MALWIPIEQYLWKRYWELIVIWEWIKTKWVRRLICKCICWRIKEIASWHVLSWHIISCWCKSSRLIIWDRRRTHWMCWKPLYNVWREIKLRCNNPKNKRYKHYWWRWISVCDKWKKFEWFQEDMEESYYSHLKIYHWTRQTSIDRIDNNGNYCKENCKWSTMKEQANNTQKSLSSKS